MPKRTSIRRLTFAVATAGSAVLCACNTLRYVPQDRYLLLRNKVEVTELHDEKHKRSDRVTPSDLKNYIRQRPNNRLLGANVYLAFYSASDTSRHHNWQRFWRDKVGEPPVVLDPGLILQTREIMQAYLASRGYRDSEVRDSISLGGRENRKATVHYLIDEHAPYTISSLGYRIDDPYLETVVMSDTARSLIRVGDIYDEQVFEAERERVTRQLLDQGFYGFSKGYISFEADTSRELRQAGIVMKITRRQAYTDARGTIVWENHPLYRITRVTVNTDYDMTKSPEELAAIDWDTTQYNGIDIVYREKKLYLRPGVLDRAMRVVPGDIYNRNNIERQSNGLRNLGYTTYTQFAVVPDSVAPPRAVVSYDAEGNTVATVERELECLVLATPAPRHNVSVEAELSTTADYYSAALALGYENRNVFRGSENLRINFRGAYEIMKNKGDNDAYEFGVTAALDIPRFMLPWAGRNRERFAMQKTTFALSYDIQRRPDYDRTIAGGSFGYSWRWRTGGNFQINPVDVNVVEVPWIDTAFLNEITNPYLRNSYTSQLIAGISASYNYQSNPDTKRSGYTLRIGAETNGNLLSLAALAWGTKQENDEETYYNLLGIRYAQYARAYFEYAGRQTLNNNTQLAWRLFAGGGVAYGNSNTLPFERLFFAGGSNSMRAWQVRTLGPGSTPAPPDTNYPNQLGDMKLEANLEFRFSVAGSFGMALFVDAGNIWMNSKGSSPDERFRFDSFYRQIALGTGIGLRYDIGYNVLLRLDWGIKVYNPNEAPADRWKTGYRLDNTVLNFAIGLPF